MAKNFLDKDGVSRLIYNFKSLFATLSHKHEISDLTDYTVDSALSSTSTNPIQNKVVNEGFSLVANSLTSMQNSIKGKADKEHEHTNYALISYVDETFAKKSDVQDVDLSNYETKEDASAKLDEAKQYTDTAVSGKANTTHSHDDIYYTETEIDSKLSSKSDTTHKHDSDYDARGTATSTVSTHNSSTSAHNDIRDLITGLTTRLNTLADSDDTTLDQMSEIVAYIKANKDLIDSITTSKVNVSDIIDNLTTNVSNKPLSAAQGVAIKGLIDALQTEVNGKVDSLSDLGITVTATELNYMTGVTSNVQYQLDAKVPTSRTINGKALTGNITLSASDVGAYSKSEINDMELITVNDIDAICGTDLLETSEVKF